MSERIEVAVVYSHFPHYRKPVFTELSTSNKYKFNFFYGENKNNSGIPGAKSDGFGTVIPTYRAGNIIIQIGLLHRILFSKDKVYIFLGNPYIISNWVYALIARWRGRKVLYWTHGWTENDAGMKGTIRRWYYNLADGLLLYGNRAKEIGLKKGFEAPFLHTIYNSLDYQAQMESREKLMQLGVSKTSPPSFLFVGRLVGRVEIDVAIRALAVLKERGIAAKISVICPPDGTASGVQLARSLGVEMELLGESYDEEVIGRAMLSACAVISPGKVGLLAMHALAYGTPVLTHGDLDRQMPEVEAIEDGLTGGFFKRGDPLGLANLMISWIENRATDAVYERAIRTIETKYTPSVQRRLIEDAIDATLGN